MKYTFSIILLAATIIFSSCEKRVEPDLSVNPYKAGNNGGTQEPIDEPGTSYNWGGKTPISFKFNGNEKVISSNNADCTRYFDSIVVSGAFNGANNDDDFIFFSFSDTLLAGASFTLINSTEFNYLDTDGFNLLDEGASRTGGCKILYKDKDSVAGLFYTKLIMKGNSTVHTFSEGFFGMKIR